MVFFRILFALALVIPMAALMIFLLGKMVDDFNLSVKNSRAQETGGSYTSDNTYGARHSSAHHKKTHAAAKPRSSQVASGKSGEKQKKYINKSYAESLSKRKRRKQRKIKKQSRKDREY